LYVVLIENVVVVVNINVVVVEYVVAVVDVNAVVVVVKM